MEQEFYKFTKELQKILKRIEQSKQFSETDKKLLFAYYDQLLVEGKAQTTQTNIMSRMNRILASFGKEIKDLTKEDTREFVRQLELSKKTEWTKKTERTALKRFFKWYKGTEEVPYPDEVRWISTTLPKRKRKTVAASDMVTFEEYKRLINACLYARDKAILACLFESGCRISEIGTMTIGRVRFDKHGICLDVDGKTGQRPVRLVNAAQYVHTWLSEHPDRENRNAPLWTKLDCKVVKQLNYAAMNRMLREIRKRAEVYEA